MVSTHGNLYDIATGLGYGCCDRPSCSPLQSRGEGGGDEYEGGRDGEVSITTDVMRRGDWP